jgi:predicted DCC family thiol-disulfide oxidoreductase YuxK
MTQEHILFFDAACSLCQNAIAKIKSWDKRRQFSCVPLDSSQAKTFFDTHAHLKHLDSLILVEKSPNGKKRIWVKGRAVLRIFWLLGSWRKLIGVFAYLPFGVDFVYSIIARHRHHFQ